MKQLSGAPLYIRVLALPINITIGWKACHGQTLSSLIRTFVKYDRKNFYNIEPKQVCTLTEGSVVYLVNIMGVRLENVPSYPIKSAILFTSVFL